MSKKMLINISNHPSSEWSDAQKEEWICIKDIPFPNVPSTDTVKDVYEKMIGLYHAVGAIINIPDDVYDYYIMIQGEYTLCYYFIWCSGIDQERWHFVVPISERNVVINPDGSKVSTFEFKGWRFIGRHV